MNAPLESLADLLRGRPFGLALSAKFFGFFAHAGLVAALEERDLRPAALSGSSAGALVGALWAAGHPAERIVEILVGSRRADFWDPVLPLPFLGERRAHPLPGLLRGDKLLALLRRHLPATFEELRVPLTVEALNLTRGRLEALSSGDLPGAVLASCAYPGLFRPARLGDDLYWDGGFVNKAPVTALVGRAEAILVHFMPSGSLAGPLSTTGAALVRGLRAMGRGLGVARREVTALQALLARERGAAVHVLRTNAPSAGPTRLHLGAEIVRAARAEASRLLARPAGESLLDPEARVLL
jgi:NTE family protein